MHKFETKYGNFVYAVVSNPSLTDDERSTIIEGMISEFKGNYPNLEHTATKQELSETELRLIKEIEEVRGEIKNTELKLSKEIKNIELKLSKEIEEVRGEIKNTELKLSKEIKDTELKLSKEIIDSKNSTIKWIVSIMFAQVVAIAGIFMTAFKLFGS